MKYKKITIIDSYNLLSGNLYDLSRSFNLDVVKSHFPHEFVKRSTLNYIGNIPPINLWNDISKEEYEKLIKIDWNLKEECLEYLKIDLESLLKVIDIFNKYILINYDIQMTDCTTISRLALNIFFKHYLKDSKIPIIRSSMFTDIKEAYYGGVTEVYKPHGFNLLYYDVNSLYPFASLNSMPGNKCFYMEDFSGSGLNLDGLFGYFYCEVKTDNNYLGLLPVRTDIGLIMPNGKWYGWYFSEELKFAVSKGYTINVIKGYNFNKEENVFSEYVKDLYQIKSKSTGHIKVIAKSLLNNLIGRFGMNIYKPITEIVQSEKLDLIITTREYNSFKELTENDYIITYYPEISKKICESHGLDYLKVLKSEVNIEYGSESKDVSLTTAAAVTSYSRIFLASIKLDILNRGGNIYYTDTDSIVTDIPLRDELIGSNLGQFKLEHKVKEAYFISAKTYCLVLQDNTTSIKAKGLKSYSLKLKDFKNLYKGITTSGMKVHSIKNFYKGSVIIKKDEIQLNPNEYRKREKIFKLGNWFDTKPLIYNKDKPLYTSKRSMNKLSNNNQKSNFSTINTKLKVCRRYMYKKCIALLIDLIIIMLIITLLSIIFTIYKVLSYYNIDVNECNLNNIISESRINYTSPTKDVIIPWYKNEFNKFMNLFLDKRSIDPTIFRKATNTFMDHVNLFSNNISISNIKCKSDSISIIFNSAKDFHFECLIAEINKLNDEVSSLKMEQNINEINHLDDIKIFEKGLKDWTDQWNEMKFKLNRELNSHKL